MKPATKTKPTESARDRLQEAIRQAARAADDAGDYARSAERYAEEAQDILDDMEDEEVEAPAEAAVREQHIADLIEMCRELAAPTVVWDEQFADANLERLVDAMREYTRKAVAA